MNDPVLSVEDLHTYFSTYAGVVPAVHGVSFPIARGETLCIVGESGCGKSVTALSIMRLIDSPGKIVKGKIHFQGENLLALPERAMRDIRGNRISMIFQEPMTSLNPVHRIGRQIGEAIRLHQAVSAGNARDRVVELLDRVGISDPARRMASFPHQLSGGMRQRVMIAMALACDPELIIADEPTTALDVTIQAQILDLMNKLRHEAGASILLITHDLGVVSEMADWVIVMYAGRIVERASATDLFEAPKHPYTLGLMDSLPEMDDPPPGNRKLHAIPGMVPSLLGLPDGCPFRDRCPRAFEPCGEKEPVLVEVTRDHWASCWLYGN